MNQNELDVLIEIFGKENVVVIEEKNEMTNDWLRRQFFFDAEKLKDLPKQDDLIWDKHELGEKMTGKVIRILLDKKFGFIKGEDNKDYFFHSTDFNGFFNDLGADYKGNRIVMVSFEPCNSKKGLRAANVTRLDDGV